MRNTAFAMFVAAIASTPVVAFAQGAPASNAAPPAVQPPFVQPTVQLGHVDISTSDRQGTIEIDGKTVSTTGAYEGDLPTGSHHVKITRDGYEAYEKHFTLDAGQVYSEAVSLRLSGSSKGEGAEQGNARPFNGIYGGLGFGALFMPGGEGNTLDRACARLGATCETPSPLGASFFAYGGYSFNPISLELFLAGSYDVASPSATFAGSATDPLIGPPRTEDFAIRRVGGLALARVRYTVDSEVVRVHGAVGVGAAFRTMFLVREAKTTDGSGLESKYAPDATPYVSPAINFDLGAHFRPSGFLGLTVGVMATIEAAYPDATPAEKNQFLVNPTDTTKTRPHPTEPYELARGAQFFLGPYIGLEFGP